MYIAECCLQLLSEIKYSNQKLIILDYKLDIELLSGDLHFCSICHSIIGSCPCCDHDFGFPFALFLNEGKEGMIVFCHACFFNKLNIFDKSKVGV